MGRSIRGFDEACQPPEALTVRVKNRRSVTARSETLPIGLPDAAALAALRAWFGLQVERSLHLANLHVELPG